MDSDELGIVKKRIYPVSFREISSMRLQYLNSLHVGHQIGTVCVRKTSEEGKGIRMKTHKLSIDCSEIKPPERNIVFTNWREPERNSRCKSLTPYVNKIRKKNLRTTLEPIHAKIILK